MNETSQMTDSSTSNARPRQLVMLVAACWLLSGMSFLAVRMLQDMVIEAATQTAPFRVWLWCGLGVQLFMTCQCVRIQSERSQRAIRVMGIWLTGYWLAVCALALMWIGNNVGTIVSG